ncbi:MAG: DUF1844 domain-containing protein [Planctomyces sp.]|nr:DUF1844 domain-containing protein [Planctomyces sp.]
MANDPAADSPTSDAAEPLANDPAAMDTAEQEPEIPADALPPPTFASLVQILSAQAMAAMGIVPGPDGKAHRQPQVAKHFIDLLAVLEDKTRDRLDPLEHKLLDESLHHLRMAFVAVQRSD